MVQKSEQWFQDSFSLDKENKQDFKFHTDLRSRPNT